MYNRIELSFFLLLIKIRIPIKITLIIIPTDNETRTVNPVASSIYLTPNSWSITKNVAMQGKYVDNMVHAIVNCCGLIPRDSSMPIAMSFLRTPNINSGLSPLPRLFSDYARIKRLRTWELHDIDLLQMELQIAKRL